jgi:glucosamine--fructose-6-phosphate aminotransferase (isomerizing)
MTSSNDYATYVEIKSQTDAWAQALEITRALSLPNAEKYDQVIFTGCGSTYYLSLAASALYQELTGRSARAMPAGELLLNSQTVVSRIANPTYLLVAISRSGKRSMAMSWLSVIMTKSFHGWQM